MPEQQQIFAGSVEAAPKDYVVGSNVEMTLRAVNADFTDNGAGGDWLPAVVLLSDSGHVIARAVDQAVKVTAGGSAEVSWFPGVKHAAASSSSGGTFHYCRVVLGPNTPSGSIALGSGTVMDIADFATDDPANYVQVDGQHWTIPQVPQTIAGYSQISGGAVTTLNGDAYIVAKSGGSIPFGIYGQNTLKHLISWFAYNLSRNIELQNQWHGEAIGADTHSWVSVITFGAVY